MSVISLLNDKDINKQTNKIDIITNTIITNYKVDGLNKAKTYKTGEIPVCIPQCTWKASESAHLDVVGSSAAKVYQHLTLATYATDFSHVDVHELINDFVFQYDGLDIDVQLYIYKILTLLGTLNKSNKEL